MTTLLADSPIPVPVQTLCNLFSSELGNVTFPEVDGAALTTAAERVVADAEAVARAEGVLAAAKEQLQEGQEALLHKAQRALAYAKVYAEESPALFARLAELSLPRSPRRARSNEPLVLSSESPLAGEAQAPKRRGRPPKSPSQSAALFEDPTQDARP